jgi:DNA-binding MarR family transcriptional regulator
VVVAARALRDAVRYLVVAHGALDNTHRPCGVRRPMAHAWALLELHQSGPMTVTALAARLHIDRTNVSRLCGRMAALGEVERAVHPDDARARLVVLTADGRRAAAEVDASSAGHFDAVLDRLELNPTELTTALHALTRAFDDVRKERR